MKKFWVLLFGLGLVGCSVQVRRGEVVPVWEGDVRQICEAELCPPVKNTGMALVLVDQAVDELFGERAEILHRVTVVYHEAGTCSRGCTGEGDLFSPSKFHVYDGDETIAGSAFVHEVLHKVIGNLYEYDEDPKHFLVGVWKDTELPGAYSVEGDIQRALIEQGL